jgi:hypothetical protein
MVQVSNQHVAAPPGLSPADSTAVTRDQARAVFGQVMGFVALMLGFLALCAYIGRDLSGGCPSSEEGTTDEGDSRVCNHE